MARRVALLLCVVAAVGATTAWATRTVHITSHISIVSHSLTFSGKVTASNSACDSGRHVTLYRTNGNNLGSATTSSSGHWTITASGSAGITLGRFYAKVRSRSDGTAGTIYVCGAATSATIPYHS
jgi:hypothetical protein